MPSEPLLTPSQARALRQREAAMLQKAHGMPGMLSPSAKARQEKRQPIGHEATAPCDTARSSLLTDALQGYYASVEASPQESSTYITETVALEAPTAV